MTDYYVDSNAGGSATGANWANAFATIAAAVSAATAGNADRIFVAEDHTEGSSSADYTITFDSGSLGYNIYRCVGGVTEGSEEYDKTTATTDNIYTTTGSYQIGLTNSVNMYGMRVVSNERLALFGGVDEYQKYYDCYFEIGDGYEIFIIGDVKLIDCTIERAGTSTNAIFQSTGSVGYLHLINCTFGSNAQASIDQLLDGNRYWDVEFVNCDLSSFSQTVFISDGAILGKCKFIGCEMPSSWQQGTYDTYFPVELIDCDFVGQSDLYLASGEAVTSNSNNYRTDGTTYAWEVVTNSNCNKTTPFYTPWIYFYSGTGSKTFDIYTATNTTRLTEETCYMEVEAVTGATAPFVSSSRTLVDFPYPDDAAATNYAAGGTWNAAATYKDYVRSSVTVGTAGYFRARLVFTETSRTATVYVDRKVEVS